MTVHMDETHDQAQLLARLRQFMFWLLLASVASLIALVALAAIFRSPVTTMLVVIVVCFVLLMFAARLQAGRGRILPAVFLISSGILVTTIVGALVIPNLLAVLVLLSLMAVVVALPYVSGRALRGLSFATGMAAVLSAILASFVTLFEPLPELPAKLLQIAFVGSAIGNLLLLLWHFHTRMTETLTEIQTANVALQAAQSSLEAQVAERTAALESALAEVESRAAAQGHLLAENAQQRATILEISVPVLPISADTLVMPLVGALDSGRLRQLHEQALRALERSSARRLLLDITGVPVVDSQVAQGLVVTVQAGRLLGAEVVLIGIRPEVAQAIVGLGLNLGSIRTFSDLQSALQAR
jgi:rsbT co-antagonist protein RsbR